MRLNLAILVFLSLLLPTLFGSAAFSENTGGTTDTKPKETDHQSTPTASKTGTTSPPVTAAPNQQAAQPKLPPETTTAANTSAEVKNGIVRIEIENKQGQQNFTYYGALVAIGVPLLVLLVTNIVTLGKIRLESAAAIKNQLRIKVIEDLKDRLSEFYDPIIALLHTNSEVFNGFGPRAFPADPYAGEEAAHIWSLMINDVILPNNKEIVKIIKTKSHLLHMDDDFAIYLRFMTHAESYNAFRETANQLHGNFAYPVDLLPNLEKFRGTILTELQKLQKELLG